MISRRACEGTPAGYVGAVTSDPPDPLGGIALVVVVVAILLGIRSL